MQTPDTYIIIYITLGPEVAIFGFYKILANLRVLVCEFFIHLIHTLHKLTKPILLSKWRMYLSISSRFLQIIQNGYSTYSLKGNSLTFIQDPGTPSLYSYVCTFLPNCSLIKAWISSIVEIHVLSTFSPFYKYVFEVMFIKKADLLFTNSRNKIP